MTKNCWPSIDAYFHDGAGSMLLCLLPIKAANTSFMTICNLLPPRLPKIHNQESLTLHWHSFSWWGREHFTIIFDYKGSEYFVYDYFQPIAHNIIQDTWPRIVDPLLMLICHGCIHNMDSFDLAYSIIHVDLEAFLVFLYTFFLITTLFYNNNYKYIF